MVCGAAALSLSGCVTESQTPFHSRGVPVQALPPGEAAAGSHGGYRLSPQNNAKYELPNGPVASPATTGRTTLSRVEVGVVPLGIIAYDGQTLPLVSPDGQFVAVQQGEAPTWEAMLAEPGVQPNRRSGLAVFQTGGRGLERVTWSTELPEGLLLGRGADDRGFLVESPQADGARWIGRVGWLGSFEWLVRGRAVNAHATFTPKGELVYTRRPVEADASDLVLLTKDGQESVRHPDKGSYEFPMCTADRSMVYVFHLSEEGLELEAIRLDRYGGDSGPAKLAATIARKPIQPKADRLQVYQMATTAQPALPARSGVLGGDEPLALFHPRMSRMAMFRLETSSFEPLAPGSMAAVMSDDTQRPGFYCSTSDGLVFFPLVPRMAGMDPPTVRVLSSPYVPRKVLGSPETMMLFGPVKGRADGLEVVKLVIGGERAGDAAR